jgi:hypothetical protein
VPKVIQSFFSNRLGHGSVDARRPVLAGFDEWRMVAMHLPRVAMGCTPAGSASVHLALPRAGPFAHSRPIAGIWICAKRQPIPEITDIADCGAFTHRRPNANALARHGVRVSAGFSKNVDNTLHGMVKSVEMSAVEP